MEQMDRSKVDSNNGNSTIPQVTAPEYSEYENHTSQYNGQPTTPHNNINPTSNQPQQRFPPQQSPYGPTSTMTPVNQPPSYSDSNNSAGCQAPPPSVSYIQPPPNYVQATSPYSTHTPGYGNTMVVTGGYPVQQSQQVIVTQPSNYFPVPVERPPNHNLAIGLAIFTTFCCNLFLGIPAIVFAVIGQSTRDNGSAKTYNKISLVLSGVGIVTGIIFIIVVVALMVTTVVKAAEVFHDTAI